MWYCWHSFHRFTYWPILIGTVAANGMHSWVVYRLLGNMYCAYRSWIFIFWSWKGHGKSILKKWGHPALRTRSGASWRWCWRWWLTVYKTNVNVVVCLYVFRRRSSKWTVRSWCRNSLERFRRRSPGSWKMTTQWLLWVTPNVVFFHC